jgi:predicted ATPase
LHRKPTAFRTAKCRLALPHWCSDTGAEPWGPKPANPQTTFGKVPRRRFAVAVEGVECAFQGTSLEDWPSGPMLAGASPEVRIAGQTMPDQVLIRFQGVEGIADTPWLTLSPGISIMTGRNNVGKSRLLEAAGRLPAALANAQANIEVAQVRVITSERIIELDPRPHQPVGRFSPAPRSYTMRMQGQSGASDYHIDWAMGQNDYLTLRQFEGQNSADTALGSDSPAFNSVRLPMQQEVNLAVSRLIYIPPERPIQAEQDTIAVDLPAPNASDLPRTIYGHLLRVTPQAAALQEIVRKIFPEVEMILTPPAGANRFTLRLRDRYARKDISLDDVGTGVARIVHLITAVLFNPAERIFLIDEPTTHLHPGSEKVLAAFLREHDEHAYVIATHSPIFINAIEPDRVWLVTRNDEAGSRVQRVFRGQLGRRHVFDELGASPGDIALAERIIFVEGATDAEIYPILLERLRLDLGAANAAILPLYGAGNAEAIQQTVEHLSGLIT